MATPTVRVMGPCKVTVIRRDTTSQVVAKTHGGVKWTEEESKKEIVYDQTGTVPYDKMSQGHLNDIEVPIGIMDLSVISFIDPSVSLVTDLSNPNKVFIERQYRIGGLDSDVLVELQLIPYVGGKPSTNPEDIITFPACAPMTGNNMSFNADTQRSFNLKFHAYQDIRRADSAVWLIGDPTATP